MCVCVCVCACAYSRNIHMHKEFVGKAISFEVLHEVC